MRVTTLRIPRIRARENHRRWLVPSKVGAGTVSISTPTTHRFKLSLGGTASFTFTGTCTNSPTTIRYRYKVTGGSFSGYFVLDAAPSGGTWTGPVVLPVSNLDYTVEVSFGNDTSVTAQVTNIGAVYFVLAIGGQSNGAGRGSSNQTTRTIYGCDDHKKLTGAGAGAVLADPTGTDGSAAGSWAVHAMTYLGSALGGQRGGLVNRAVGGTKIANWQKGAGTGYYEALSADVTTTGGCSVLFMDIGESDSDDSSPTSQASFHAGMVSFATDWFADHPECMGIVFKTLQMLGTSFSSQAHQDAISNAASANDIRKVSYAEVRTVPAYPGDTFHWLTNEQLADVGGIFAQVAYRIMRPNVAPTFKLGV
jgi:flavin-binding protein dodecin